MANYLYFLVKTIFCLFNKIFKCTFLNIPSFNHRLSTNFSLSLNQDEQKFNSKLNHQEISFSCRLQGKVAIITGGASGIGECCARQFVKQGAKVVIADIQDELGRSLCKQIGSEETTFYVHCDVSSDSDVQNAVDLAVSKYGKLDIMFSNAGMGGKTGPGILSTDNEDFKRVFNVNMFGAFLAAKHAARVMIPEKKGCILFTASIAAVTCMHSAHPYVVSKYGVIGLTKNLCIELGQHGIRVNCISPYAVVTPLVQKSMGLMAVEKEKIEKLASDASNLKEAVLEAEDIAEAAIYLVSDESKYVNGINLVVDGGFSVTNPAFEMAMKNLHTS
ncbi:short chain aldehyde dehydrogenase 1-like [Mercurialis annua]|uniref:short chain aldehyde dehydrogenase 1-like n=1 Tax=Mercurialis annua TaxID=3986 RepID=UPI0024AFE182|nr:short chain aldehyde dehydrogenase 1-like [Mercurialis annua]